MLLNTGECKESLGHVVKIISVARSEWGNKYIETLSKDMRVAFPGIRGFSVRSLKYMAKFAREVDSELCNSYCTILWGHVVILLDKTNPGKRREWYRQAIIENGWSRAVLDHQIDLQPYECQQLVDRVANFSRTLPALESELVLPTPHSATIKGTTTCLEVV